MSQERFFVTGALGCIGAWVVRHLVRDNITVTAFDLGDNPHRLKLIMSDDEVSKVNFVKGDVTDTAGVEQAMRDAQTTHVVHLAALQVPFCKANPPLGARVNVVGTINIFEAAQKLGLKHLAYASSVAIYGRGDEYPPGVLKNDALPNPRNLYGVFKLANQGTAFVYHQDYGINSIGLRPYTVYGPGRDQGMTSTPTKAMLSAAAGRPYHISFGGRNSFQFAGDVASIFIQAARARYDGAGTFNLGGTLAHMQDIVAAIDAAAPEMKGKITFEDQPLALPDGTEDTELVSAIGAVQDTPLDEGIAFTVSHFRQALAENKVTLDQLAG